MACPRYAGWNAETATAKRRFRTPGCHALLHAVLQMADEIHKEIGPTAAEAEAVAVLRQREGELASATKSANAFIEEDLDEAV